MVLGGTLALKMRLYYELCKLLCKDKLKVIIIQSCLS